MSRLCVVIAALAGVACLTPATGLADPSSVAAALRDLHRSAALGSPWSGFGVGSWVRVKIHDVSADTGEVTLIRVEEVARRTDQTVFTRYLDADRKEDLGAMYYELDVPDLAEAKAVKLGDDTVALGGKLYPAQLYRFERKLQVLRETRTISWQFWLAPGVPRGELRRVTHAESTDPTYGDDTDLRLTDLKVPCSVGGKSLSCYCEESETREVGGAVERLHACFNESVPGGIVKKDARRIENGQETLRQEYILIDYHVEPLR